MKYIISLLCFCWCYVIGLITSRVYEKQTECKGCRSKKNILWKTYTGCSKLKYSVKRIKIYEKSKTFKFWKWGYIFWNSTFSFVKYSTKNSFEGQVNFLLKNYKFLMSSTAPCSGRIMTVSILYRRHVDSFGFLFIPLFVEV